jgi:hypothetical protein
MEEHHHFTEEKEHNFGDMHRKERKHTQGKQ